MNDFREVFKWIGAALLVIVAVIAIWFFSKADDIADKAIADYEEFHTIKTTCDQINENICSLREIPDDDKSFELISKASQLNAQKSQLSRWVNEYNAKSNMVTRSLWKGGSLPYQLSVEDYPCYNNPN